MLLGKTASVLLSALLSFSIILILHPIAALAAQDEAYGVVTNVVNGDTFDVTIEKADSRVVYTVERIHLADVKSPDIDTAAGSLARDYTFAVLLNKRVYLDIDDVSERGRDSLGRLICVACLAGVYGQPITEPNFNRMLVDSGHASIQNATDNEFNPNNWYSTGNSEKSLEPLQDLQKDLLPKISDSVGSELEKAAQEGWGWLKGQITARFMLIFQ
jgi:endonuclease YncB( thermonuclease family)